MDHKSCTPSMHMRSKMSRQVSVGVRRRACSTPPASAQPFEITTHFKCWVYRRIKGVAHTDRKRCTPSLPLQSTIIQQ